MASEERTGEDMLHDVSYVFGKTKLAKALVTGTVRPAHAEHYQDSRAGSYRITLSSHWSSAPVLTKHGAEKLAAEISVLIHKAFEERLKELAVLLAERADEFANASARNAVRERIDTEQ